MSFHGLHEECVFRHYPYDAMLRNAISYMQHTTVWRVVWRDSRLRRQKANPDIETSGYKFPQSTSSHFKTPKAIYSRESACLIHRDALHTWLFMKKMHIYALYA